MQNALSTTPTSASFHGFITDAYDALLLITAARLGLIPRFRRRLNANERVSMIRSGSVFLWTEEESCMKRWTDGVPWSPSRIQLEFLLYREMVDRGSARARTSSRLVPAGVGAASSKDERFEGTQGVKAVRALAGSLFNQGELDEVVQRRSSGRERPNDVFRRGGLMKKTFSAPLPGATWHLVSYYTLEDALMGCLQTPKESPFFEGLSISADLHKVYSKAVGRKPLGVSIRSLDKTFPSPPLVASPSVLNDLAQSPGTRSNSPGSTFTLEEMYLSVDVIPSKESLDQPHHYVDSMSPDWDPSGVVYFRDDPLKSAWSEPFPWQTNVHYTPTAPL